MIFLQQIFDIFLHSDLQQQWQKNAVNQYSIFCNISCMAPAQRRFYIFKFVILSLESQQKCIKFNIILFLQKLILCSLLAINKIHFLKCCHALVSNTQQVQPQIIKLLIFVTCVPSLCVILLPSRAIIGEELQLRNGWAAHPVLWLAALTTQ